MLLTEFACVCGARARTSTHTHTHTQDTYAHSRHTLKIALKNKRACMYISFEFVGRWAWASRPCTRCRENTFYREHILRYGHHAHVPGAVVHCTCVCVRARARACVRACACACHLRRSIEKIFMCIYKYHVHAYLIRYGHHAHVPGAAHLMCC